MYVTWSCSKYIHPDLYTQRRTYTVLDIHYKLISKTTHRTVHSDSILLKETEGESTLLDNYDMINLYLAR